MIYITFKNGMSDELIYWAAVEDKNDVYTMAEDTLKFLDREDWDDFGVGLIKCGDELTELLCIFLRTGVDQELVSFCKDLPGAVAYYERDQINDAQDLYDKMIDLAKHTKHI